MTTWWTACAARRGCAPVSLPRPELRLGVTWKCRTTPASDQHRHLAAAPFLRLYLRGRLEEVGPVIVTLSLHQDDRGAQARLAWEQITSHDPITLLERLSELD